MLFSCPATMHSLPSTLLHCSSAGCLRNKSSSQDTNDRSMAQACTTYMGKIYEMQCSLSQNLQQMNLVVVVAVGNVSCFPSRAEPQRFGAEAPRQQLSRSPTACISVANRSTANLRVAVLDTEGHALRCQDHSTSAGHAVCRQTSAGKLLICRSVQCAV